MFIASIVGVIVTMIHTLTSGIQFGVGELVGIIAMPLVVAALLIWYARYSDKKRWLS